MAIVNAREMLMKAAAGGYAVGAFNVTSIMQMKAVIDAAAALQAPVIIQTSESPAKQMGPEVAAAAYGVMARSAAVPVVLHLDHCTDIAFCKRCIDAGYTNIMIDASSKPFEENIALTREVVDYARTTGRVTVEGELGTVGGVEDQIEVVEDSARLCDPKQAVRFVTESGVDLFAPAIGTAHGVYKTADPKIDVARLQRIREVLAAAGLAIPLVIHGGTGLPEETVRALIASGGAKYNVSTELKYAWIDGAADFLKENRGVYNPGKLLARQMEYTARVVAKWIGILGSSGKGAGR